MAGVNYPVGIPDVFPLSLLLLFLNVVSPYNGALVAVFEFSVSRGEPTECERGYKESLGADRKWQQRNLLSFLGLGWGRLKFQISSQLLP